MIAVRADLSTPTHQEATPHGTPCGCQCHAGGVGWLAPRLFLPSWLVSLMRPVDARGPADLA
jgi:hypothetical protein